MFLGWTPHFLAVFSGCGSGRLLVAVALGLGLVALGVGCLSLVVLSLLVLFLFCGVRVWAEMRPENRKGTDPKTCSDPKITLGQVHHHSMFWDFGSLHQKPRVAWVVTDQMVGCDPFCACRCAWNVLGQFDFAGSEGVDGMKLVNMKSQVDPFVFPVALSISSRCALRAKKWFLVSNVGVT